MEREERSTSRTFVLARCLRLNNIQNIFGKFGKIYRSIFFLSFKSLHPDLLPLLDICYVSKDSLLEVHCSYSLSLSLSIRYRSSVGRDIDSIHIGRRTYRLTCWPTFDWNSTECRPTIGRYIDTSADCQLVLGRYYL